MSETKIDPTTGHTLRKVVRPKPWTSSDTKYVWEDQQTLALVESTEDEYQRWSAEDRA